MHGEQSLVGKELGNYRLISSLGRGGYAEVYLGEHVLLHRLAAIKVLHSALSGKDTVAFQREAEIIANLDHPHIVRVLDFDLQDDIPFLVMEATFSPITVISTLCFQWLGPPMVNALLPLQGTRPSRSGTRPMGTTSSPIMVTPVLCHQCPGPLMANVSLPAAQTARCRSGMPRNWIQHRRRKISQLYFTTKRPLARPSSCSPSAKEATPDSESREITLSSCTPA